MSLPVRMLAGPSTRDGMLGVMMREHVTSGYPVITTDHAFIHEGIAYVFGGSQSVGGTSAYSIAFDIPEGVYVHFKPTEVSANGGPVTVAMLEGATHTGGTAVDPTNKNRISENESGIVLTRGVTPSGGDTIDSLYIAGATTGANRFGAASGAEEEFVLKPGMNYVFTFTNTSGTAVTIGWRFFWYEEGSA